MANSDTEVVIIGGGAAGIAAARQLARAAIDCLLLEARPRLGGRAWTVTASSGFSLDLGCGWLHSAESNPWAAIAEEQGRIIDRSPPPWQKPALPIGFPRAEQQEYIKAMRAFFARVDAVPPDAPDAAAATLLEPGCRWNGMIEAVGTYITGGNLDRVSIKDFNNYADTEVNWRVVEGYGATVMAHGAGLRVEFDCAVRQIDHSGRRLRIETARGDITADQAVITLPSALIADKEFLFAPVLAEKIEAALGLPVGLADKAFLAFDGAADAFEPDTRLFGRTDTSATATYHLRPFGRPLIEVYFGGDFAWQLEAEGERAFFAYALTELTSLFGADTGRCIRPLRMHLWGTDPFAGGSYSYALPGRDECRAVLAAPVEGRLFFAGEACSRHDFSTAHGAYRTGVAAAEQVIAARQKKRD